MAARKKKSDAFLLERPVPSIPEVIAGHARHRGAATALIFEGRSFSWRQLDERLSRVANLLLARGVKKGERVCLLSTNCVEALEVWLGVLRAGGVIVPLSSMLTANLVELMVKDSGARFLFAHAELLDLTTGDLGLPGDARFLFGGAGAGTEGWQAYDEAVVAADASDPSVGVGLDDNCNIIYSSGTTGVPKGIVHTHYARIMWSQGMAAEFLINSDAITIIVTALYSNGTLLTLLPTIYAGGTVVLMPEFEPSGFMKAVERYRATHVFMVPTQFGVVLEHADFGKHDLSSLKTMISGGSTMPLPLKKGVLERIGPGLTELYGLTEGFATTLKPSEVAERTASVGRPMLGCDVRIIDDAGRELPAGEIGEIAGTSPILLTHYHNRPEATEEMVWCDQRGKLFIRSGDMGRIDEDGYLYILDRKKDMIISGGINIYASDLEAVFREHEDVKDCAVIAAPHDKWGETPMALIVVRAGSTPSLDALKDWANARLAKYQRVSEVRALQEDFPRNALGKVLKRELRERFVQNGSR